MKTQYPTCERNRLRKAMEACDKLVAYGYNERVIATARSAKRLLWELLREEQFLTDYRPVSKIIPGDW